MSVSKLESLSNEILIDLLEKYMNGVDVFVAFAIQLNKRFDGLINQCQQLHFNFESIRTNDFRRCIQVLPDYRDIIQSLTLSERDTPGQIHAFLSFFPTFDQFTRLRRLHFNFDGNTVEKMLFIKAIQSLLKTNIKTLSIKGENAREIFEWSNILTIFTIKTLRRLFFDLDIQLNNSNFHVLTSVNVEHLTIKGWGCTWKTLKTIFQSATRLSYLNARIFQSSRDCNQFPVKKMLDVQPLINLHTLILQYIEHDTSEAFETLGSYLRIMVHLRHLQIIDIYGRFFNGFVWRKIFETSLPLLSTFVLKSGIIPIGKCYWPHFLTSFQTPFWIEKTTFNVFIITDNYTDESFMFDYRTINSTLYLNDHIESKQRSRSFWTIPQRSVIDTSLLLNHVTNLHLSSDSSILSTEYYFNNVKRLTVNHLNSFLFKWITKNINLLNVTVLLIPSMKIETDLIKSLLLRTENISSLQIRFNQLFDLTSTDRYNSVKRLDISLNEHRFRREDILVLQRIFPSIEHLKMNTRDLKNVSLLNKYFPNLHSLTFNVYPSLMGFDDFLDHFEYQLRIQTQFLCKLTNSWITIWIDEATFQEPFWHSGLTIDHELYAERPSKFNKNKCICC